MVKNQNQELTARFSLERETKGAVRYSEVDTEIVGTLYIRKAALSEPFPKELTVTIHPG